MKGAAKEEFLKSLKIKKSEIIADNYEELIDKKLTTRALYDYLIEHQDIMDSTDTEFVEALLLGRDPSRAILNYAVNSKCEERLATLKNKLNVGAITDANKAFSYAYFYYTNPKYEACCRNTDDLYKLASNLGKANILEHAVFDYLISNNKLVKNNDKLMCFTFYQNFMANNIKDESLQSHYFDYDDLMKIITTQHNNVIEKAEAKTKRDQIKDQLNALDTNSILDTITDLSVDKLKAAYPYCAVIKSTYSSGWAQDSFKVSISYYFTNLSKGEIKKYLKEHGVNVKDTDSGYYNNGYSSHYEYGGTARGRKTNSYEFVPSSEIGDIKVGNEYIYNAYTAGTSITNYVHVIAKPTDDGNQYRIKSHSGKLYLNKDYSDIPELDIFGNNHGDRSSVNPFYSKQALGENKTFMREIDEYLEDIKNNINNDDVTYELSGHFYINNNQTNENIYVNGERLSTTVLELISTKYNLKITANCYDYFHVSANSSSEKTRFVEFLEDATKIGIAIMIPETYTTYLIAKEDDANYYLVKKMEIITDSSKLYPISKSLFKEFFEKV